MAGEASTTSLASSANPAIVGQSFTLTATVSAFQVGSVLPDAGTVSFFDGATLLGPAPVVNGRRRPACSIYVRSRPVPLTASQRYSPATPALPGEARLVRSLALTSLYPADSTFLVTGTGSNVSPPITFTLAVASQEDQFATGLVEFFDGSTLIGSASLNSAGVATFITDAITAGSHTFTADPAPAAPSSRARHDGLRAATIGKAQSQSGDVVSSAPQVYYGQDVTLTATFTANYNGTNVMTGTVAFYDGTTYLGTATLKLQSAERLADGYDLAGGEPHTRPDAPGLRPGRPCRRTSP